MGLIGPYGKEEKGPQGWPHPSLLLYIWGQGGTPKTQQQLILEIYYPCAVPPPQFTPPVIVSQCLGEALRGSHQQLRHHAVVLTELFLDPLLDQEFEGRHRAKRVLNSEVSYVRRLDRNQPRSESLRVRLLHPRSCNACASRSSRV